MTNPMQPRRGVTWRRTAFATILLAGTALGGLAVGHAVAAQTNGVPVNPPGATAMPQTLPDFSNLVTQVKPAVVSITNRLNSEADGNDQMQGRGQQLPPPFNQFPFNQMIPQQPQAQAVEARGSGFIINPDGTIITNNHVVKDAKTLTVTLDDGSTLNAKVLGTDPRSDIAVLKVDAPHPLPFIQLGNSADVKPGQWVVAVGNPFGLGGTVTAGIVSAVSRDIGSSPYRPVHPDRRPDQPGQLRRAAVHPGRQGGRDEHRHPVADRRLDRHRVRDPPTRSAPSPPNSRPAAMSRGVISAWWRSN